ncbi:flavodoxin family protein [Actinophytocola algeriensis]|jgi:multimeric flavodoxin WrbA|uniref:Multimeric flavodoxin WrbA n=1 Tax=Actinophytocola algeriensis TaxID=1768010 RepID=A0A7W7Q1D2_9PSEU|nr:flavodoxin family protein [Actinophytocola algeriensis]MBB4905210.1 multimeric flavodoxin WrbA [Actinophytocola algeriensis]MBE1473105.1 multimeric flavodoxin WrbA [Actinophytocola algeriensis]
MRALILNCTLKKSPADSNTQKLADVVGAELGKHGVEVESVRVADLRVEPGVETDMGDDWTAVHEKLLAAEILVVASPTWLGRPSSVAQRVLERMDAMISETGDDDRPVAYDRVAGVVVTGNEDGAHHVISEITGALNDIGYTIPGQAWTYWNMGPGPGPDYSDTDHGHEWSEKTAATMASNLLAVATALAKQPIPA